MAKHQTKIRSAVEYACLSTIAAIFSRLPFFLGSFLMCAAADLWRCIDRKHRLRAIEQSMARLGIDHEQARRLVKKNYRHYGLVFLEMIKLRSMSPDELMRRTDLNGCDRVIRDTFQQGKGLVILTGHLGNWEWGCAVMGMLNAAAGAIARPLDNPYVDSYVNAIREKTGVAVWSKFNCMRRAVNVLRRGAGFLAVVDQDGGRKGCMVPFLGEYGSTMTTPVDLAIRHGVPIYVGAVMRRGEPGRFVIETGRVHHPRQDASPEAERIRLLTEINADLSGIIRKYPEQWIWIHKRWKTTKVRNTSPSLPATQTTAAQNERQYRLVKC